MKFRIRPPEGFDFYRSLDDVTREPFGLTECLREDRYSTSLFQGMLTISQNVAGGDLAVEWKGDTRPGKVTIEKEIERQFGLGQDLERFRRTAKSNPKLSSVVEKLNGLTVFQKSTHFEALVTAITDQQLTTSFTKTLKRRLILTYGDKVDGGDTHLWNFPSPETLAGLKNNELRSLQYSGSKSRSIIELAKGVASGNFPLHSWNELDDEDLLQHLTEIYGVGRWTAEYTALIGYGRCDVIPADDIGLQRGLEILYGMSHRPEEDEVRSLAEEWRPYRGLATYYIWRQFE